MGMVLLFMVAVYQFIIPTFVTNDDVGMLLEVAGVGRSHVASAYLLHSNFICGFFLKTLYSIGSFSTPWYSFYIIGILAIAFAVFTYSSLREKQWEKLLLLPFFFLLVATDFAQHLQFTISASMLGLAGVTLLLAAQFSAKKEEDQTESTSAEKRRLNLVGIISMVLICGSAMVRWKASWLVLALGIPVTIFYFMIFRDIYWKRKLLYLLIGAFLTIAIQKVNNYVWHQEAEWGEIFDFNVARGTLHGNNPLDYLEREDRLAVLDKVGWSLNDYQLFKTFYFQDEEVYNKETLNAIIAELPALKRVSLEEVFESFKGILMDDFTIKCLVLFLGSLLFLPSTWREKVFLVGCFFLLLGLILGLIFYLRSPPARVYMPMFAFLSLLPLLFIRKQRGEKIGMPLRIVKGIAGITLLILIVPSTLAFYQAENDKHSYQQAEFDHMVRYIGEQYPDQLIVTWGASFFYEYMNPFADLYQLSKMQSFHIGCSQRTPSSLQTLENYNMKNVFRDMADRKDVVLVSKGKFKERLYRNYLKEHFGLYSTVDQIFSTGRFNFYRTSLVDYQAN